MPRWSPVYFFFVFFDISSLMWPNRTKQGFQCRLCLTLRMTLLARILQGLGPIPQTTTWKQLNAIKNSFSCDFNKTATRDVVPKHLPMPAGFTKDTFRTPQLTVDCWLYEGHFRTPQMTARPESRLLALRRTFQDSTNDSTTRESTAGFTKDMSGHHKWQHDNWWLTFVSQNLKISGQVFRRPKILHQKIFLATAHLPGSFCRQLWWTLWNGQRDKCKVKVGKHNLSRQPLQVADPTNLPQFGKRSLTRHLL
jgi:hypothetical protein